ncbi:hypothetical protein [Micromonospora okii]|uniref:hypothetical protein n=1 Tax=Micromonospora okii TaxID=1182970 RepID=UPI001E2F3EF4|nr:hypothetical protein [Micromonospora okii]
MAILGTRARRAALTLLAGTALAGLLGATATAAPPQAEPDRIMTVTDIYIRDVVADLGYQPHMGTPLWNSSDIKVCPTAVECATSQWPVVGMTNYVFVKLRNPGPYGSGTDTGILRLLRTTPGGGRTWPLDWTQIAAQTVTVPPGVTTVVIPWGAVPGPGHFSILARWESPNDPIVFEGPDISINTQYNNNIAWKDLLSV